MPAASECTWGRCFRGALRSSLSFRSSSVTLTESIDTNCDNLYPFCSEPTPAHAQLARGHLRSLPLGPNRGRPPAGTVLLGPNSNLHRGRNMKLQSTLLRNSLL